MLMLMLMLSSTTNIDKGSHRCFVQICLTSSNMPFHTCCVNFTIVSVKHMMNKAQLYCLTNVSFAIYLLLSLTMFS